MQPGRRLYLFILPVLFFMACSNKENKKPNGNPGDSSALKNASTGEYPYVMFDISPMDMSYCPDDYPKMKMAKTISTPPLARLIYSRPHLQGRVLFHDLLKYGEPWRLGANESTELDLYHDAVIQNKKITEGRYVLYCIPQPDKWTIAINSNIDSWGLQPDSTKDIARFVIPVIHTSNHLEYLTIVFEKTTNGADMLMAWDDLEARLPISF